MWPWEHLAVGYLFYSAYARVRTDGPPDGPSAVTVVIATQLPDLIDKPLAWTFGVYPGGYSIGHSVFVAILLSILVAFVSRRIGRPHLGAAFAIGYLSHLPGDLLYLYVTNGYLNPAIVLWPIVSPVGAPTGGGLLANFVTYVRGYAELVASGQFLGLVLLELSLLVAALVVWIFDGLPGVAGISRWISHVVQPE